MKKLKQSYNILDVISFSIDPCDYSRYNNYVRGKTFTGVIIGIELLRYNELLYLCCEEDLSHNIIISIPSTNKSIKIIKKNLFYKNSFDICLYCPISEFCEFSESSNVLECNNIRNSNSKIIEYSGYFIGDRIKDKVDKTNFIHGIYNKFLLDILYDAVNLGDLNITNYGLIYLQSSYSYIEVSKFNKSDYKYLIRPLDHPGVFNLNGYNFYNFIDSYEIDKLLNEENKNNPYIKNIINCADFCSNCLYEKDSDFCKKSCEYWIIK